MSRLAAGRSGRRMPARAQNLHSVLHGCRPHAGGRPDGATSCRHERSLQPPAAACRGCSARGRPGCGAAASGSWRQRWRASAASRAAGPRRPRPRPPAPAQWPRRLRQGRPLARRCGGARPKGVATTTFAVVSLSTGASCRRWLLPFLAAARRVPLGCSPNTPLCSAHAWPAGPVCRDQAHNRTAVEAPPRCCYKGRCALSRGSMCRTHAHNSARLVLRAVGGATELAARPRAGAAPVPVPRSTARTSAHCPKGGARSRYSASTNALCHTTWRRVRMIRNRVRCPTPWHAVLFTRTAMRRWQSGNGSSSSGRAHTMLHACSCQTKSPRACGCMPCCCLVIPPPLYVGKIRCAVSLADGSRLPCAPAPPSPAPRRARARAAALRRPPPRPPPHLRPRSLLLAPHPLPSAGARYSKGIRSCPSSHWNDVWQSCSATSA